MMRNRQPFVNNDGMSIKSDGLSSGNELVARNVRRYRRERAMSIGELARRSGLSKQTLSKIEQGEGNPTVDTLSMLAGALDVPARRFLTEFGTPVYVQREQDGVWIARAVGHERLLDETYGSGYVRTMVVRLQRGEESAVIDPQPPGTLVHLYVNTGRIRTGPVNDPVDVAAGDFVRFPADLAHRHQCLSERAAAHVVMTIPQIGRYAPTITRNGDPESP